MFNILQHSSPITTTTQLIEAIRNNLSTNQNTSSSSSSPPPSPSSSSPCTITIEHLYKTTPVEYNVHGWVKYNRQVAQVEKMRSFLLRYTSQEIRDTCFVESINAINIPSSSSPPTSSSSSPLTSSSSSSSSSTHISHTRMSILLQDTNALLDELKTRQTRFVFCWQPRHNSKSSSSSPSQSSSSSPSSSSSSSSPHKTTTTIPNESPVDIHLLQLQCRSTCLLMASTLHRLSYPEYFTYAGFVHKFAILLRQQQQGQQGQQQEDDVVGGLGDYKMTTQVILKQHNVDPSTYKFGKTKIFFRSGALSMLNVMCDDAMNTWVVTLQSFCRGMLARRKATKLRVSTEAMQCIQVAVRNYLEWKAWKWWKLFDKVRHVARFCTVDDNEEDDNEDAGRTLLDSPTLNGSCYTFDDGTNTSDIINDSIIEDFSLIHNHSNDNNNHHHHHRPLHHSTPRRYHHRHGDMSGGIRHLDELDSADAQSVADNSSNSTKLSLDKSIKEIKMKKQQLRQLNSLIDEKAIQNERLTGLHRGMQRDAANKDEMLKFEIQQKEQLLKEIKQLEQDKLIAKQQLEDALYDLERETGKRRDAEVKMNLYCGANDEYEKLKKSNSDLLKDKKKYLTRLENQENTIKQLIETLSKLEVTNIQLKQDLNKMDRWKGEEMDGKKATYLKEMHLMETKMNDILKQKDQQLGAMSLNEARLKQTVTDCRDRFKIREKALRGRMRKLAEVLKSDQSKKEKPNHVIKMLRSKLEDMEDEMDSMKRVKRGLEGEVTLVQGQLDSALEAKNDAEVRNRLHQQVNGELESQMVEKDDEHNEMMKKYYNLVQQNSLELDKLRQQSEELESLRETVKVKSQEVVLLESKLSRMENTMVSNHVISRMEAKMADMKTNMEANEFARKQAENHLLKVREVLQRERCDKTRIQEVSMKKDEQITSLQDVLKVHKSRVICLEARIQDLEAIIHQLRRKIDEQQDECKGHTDEIGLLNRRIIAIQSNASTYWVNDDDDDDDDEDINKILARGKVILLSPRKSLLSSSEA